MHCIKSVCWLPTFIHVVQFNVANRDTKQMQNAMCKTNFVDRPVVFLHRGM